jgi:predicted dehydrogenase
VRDPLARPGASNIRISLPTAADIEAGKTKRTRVRGEATYWYQMRAFVDAIRNGTPVLTGPEDAVKNMEVIDAIYRAAGLRVREPTP